ncbi:hypothetical protein K503DRAFT_772907, partial [Rhizopogon vinicolor AM-OR11-026]
SSANCHHAKFPHTLGPGRGSVFMFVTNTFGRMRLDVSRGLLVMKSDQVHVMRCGDSRRDMKCGGLHDWFDADSKNCSTATRHSIT